MQFTFTPIGTVRSPFKEKFTVPRQSGLLDAIPFTLELHPPCNDDNILRGLADFSHIWLVFIFHLNLEQGWKPTVRPPRLGGNRRVGVFATRSGFRPNPIGMTTARLNAVRKEGKNTILDLSGADLVDGTPVLDIKPYLPYSDRIDDASGGYAQTPPSPDFRVIFTPEALAQCRAYQQAHQNDLRTDLQPFIERLLAYDARPACRRKSDSDRIWGVRMFDFNLRWRVEDDKVIVVALAPSKQDSGPNPPMVKEVE